MTPATASLSVAEPHYSLRRFRQALGYFISGRVIAALLALATFAIIVRYAAVTEYGAYVTLLAAMELAIALSTLGVDWIGLRYLPECRLSGSRRTLRRFIVGLLVVHGLTLLIGACIASVVLDSVAGLLDLAAWRGLILWWVAILVIEGLARFTRDVVLGSLMLQGFAQGALVMRNAVQLAALIGLLATGATIDAMTLTQVELIAALVSAIAALGLLAMALRPSNGATPEQKPWRLPEPARLGSVAFHNYATAMLGQAYSPQVLTLLAGTLFGAAGAALFGFCLRVMDLVNKHLPGNFLMQLLRPMLLAKYLDGRNFGRLNSLVLLVHKVSVILLMPAIVLVGLHGSLIIGAFTGDKYVEAPAILLVLFVYLIARNHLTILGIVLNALERMGLATRAALCTLVLLPVLILLGASGLGPMGLAIGMLVESVALNGLVLLGLRRAGFAYQVQAKRFARVVLAGLLAYLPIAWLGASNDWPGLVFVQGTLAMLVLAGALFLVRPFTREEIGTMRAILPRFAAAKSP
jgi:O-antigen/teichoic acid export membrane protein